MNQNLKWAKELDTPQVLTNDLKDTIVETIEDLVENTYVYVSWPDSQEYMDEPWFDNEAILDINNGSCYLIPTKYVS